MQIPFLETDFSPCRRTRRRVAAGIVLLLWLLISSTTAARNNPTPDPTTLQLKWDHIARFAGFYLAQELGYYAQENLAVSMERIFDPYFTTTDEFSHCDTPPMRKEVTYDNNRSD